MRTIIKEGEVMKEIKPLTKLEWDTTHNTKFKFCKNGYVFIIALLGSSKVIWTLSIWVECKPYFMQRIYHEKCGGIEATKSQANEIAKKLDIL